MVHNLLTNELNYRWTVGLVREIIGDQLNTFPCSSVGRASGC